MALKDAKTEYVILVGQAAQAIVVTVVLKKMGLLVDDALILISAA